MAKQQQKQLQDDFWTALSEGNALFFLHNKHSFTTEFLKQGKNGKGKLRCLWLRVTLGTK